MWYGACAVLVPGTATMRRHFHLLNYYRDFDVDVSAYVT